MVTKLIYYTLYFWSIHSLMERLGHGTPLKIFVRQWAGHKQMVTSRSSFLKNPCSWGTSGEGEVGMLPPDLLQVCSSIARELRRKAFLKKKKLSQLFPGRVRRRDSMEQHWMTRVWEAWVAGCDSSKEFVGKGPKARTMIDGHSISRKIGFNRGGERKGGALGIMNSERRR